MATTTTTPEQDPRAVAKAERAKRAAAKAEAKKAKKEQAEAEVTKATNERAATTPDGKTRVVRPQDIEDPELGLLVRKGNGRLSARGLTCLCGCGNDTHTRDARFLSGHDAKLRAEVLRANLDAEVLPAIVRPFFAHEQEPIAGLVLDGDVLVDTKGQER